MFINDDTGDSWRLSDTDVTADGSGAFVYQF
jgi:hypothetical protein